ncbi:hypothetical protein CERZMDRAFT_106633 [Cercospora zeae-maydis SCOH1-5]|uniref:Uncharacterized protein n=1 Tax=Cercospora zeae-maydis SCOH1-5 TaxID=717836 RepID=A0A6A6FBJ3_9PEZI|nr:hypothetical protein CERZMDRAFT_106633 [Cercospora zeae-maydis SCOH1-5]
MSGALRLHEALLLLPVGAAVARRAAHSAAPAVRNLPPSSSFAGHGRRLRLRSTQLRHQDVDDEPTNVIVLYDDDHGTVPRPATDSAAHTPHRAPSARDVEHAITGRGPAPDAAEVNASIDALRPDATVLEPAHFERLRQHLADSYTLPQLLRYLRTHLRPDAPRAADAASKPPGNGLQAAPWQPHRTPLHLRRPKLLRPAVAAVVGSKVRATERVLRLVWSLTVVPEEQQVGELELALHSWQLSMLFDLTAPDGRPYHASLLSPPRLSEATEIEQYRPDGIVRITGRRCDAEEVASQLQQALSAVRTLRVRLADLAAPASAPCNDEEMALVSSVTKSVIVSHGSHMLTIYNRTDVGANHARRLLLSILNWSPLSAGTTTSSYTPPTSPKHASLPVDSMAAGLHVRDSSRYLARQAAMFPETPTDAVTSPAQRHTIAAVITGRLRKAESVLGLGIHEPLPSGYWKGNETTLSNWRADFVKLLGTDGLLDSQEALKHHVTQYRLPGIESALSTLGPYLAPHRTRPGDASTAPSALVDHQAPQLKAHLVPKPTHDKSSHILPRIELRFGFAANDQREPMFCGMRAIVQAQSLQVPLPSCAVDILFSQYQALVADVDAARQDPEIAKFARELERSMRSRDEILSAPPELNVLLPASIVHDQARARGVDQLCSATYLLERFEQTQSRDFLLSHQFLFSQQQELEGTPFDTSDSDLRLQYKEVDGGAVYGASTQLTLRAARVASHRTDGVEDDGDNDAALSEGSGTYLASTALAVADLLTKAAQRPLRNEPSAQTIR